MRKRLKKIALLAFPGLIGFMDHTYLCQFGANYSDSYRTCSRSNLSFLAETNSVAELLSTLDVAHIYMTLPRRRALHIETEMSKECRKDEKKKEIYNGLNI